MYRIPAEDVSAIRSSSMGTLHKHHKDIFVNTAQLVAVSDDYLYFPGLEIRLKRGLGDSYKQWLS